MYTTFELQCSERIKRSSRSNLVHCSHHYTQQEIIPTILLTYTFAKSCCTLQIITSQAKKYFKHLQLGFFTSCNILAGCLDVYSPQFNNRNMNKLNVETVGASSCHDSLIFMSTHKAMAARCLSHHQATYGLPPSAWPL